MAARPSDERWSPSRPMNVQEIVNTAQSFDFNALIPLRYWFRTAGTILKEAEIYEHEGNDQQTYLLLFRHAQLVLKYLTSHPDINLPEHKEAWLQAEKDVARDLAKLEILKPRINRRHERYEQLMKDRDSRKAAQVSQNPGFTSNLDGAKDNDKHRRMRSDPAVAGVAETSSADDDKELAVKLAHKEFKRRATVRKAMRQAGISEEVEQERRTAGVWGDWEEALAKDDDEVDRDTLSRRMQDIHLQSEALKSNGSSTNPPRLGHEGSCSAYNYPTIPERKNQGHLASKSSPSSFARPGEGRNGSYSSQPPKPPPKDGPVSPQRSSPQNPPKPPKQSIPAFQAPSRVDTASPTQSDPKPRTFTFKPSAYLENGSPLRTIFLPPTLRHSFLSLAQTNTRANLETCGILCGTLVSNALFISKLVIPDQESTSDTCETINESELFDYVDGEDLMVLGWIHTHPTQTCFMSSRDLHTHCGYQVMMPESIAIVCAPSKGDWGVFRLTDPPGMKSVLNCTQAGLFHPHAETNIYTDALRPGHVHEAKGLEFEVVDLRPKK
ncbi:hypothetical protein MMC30_003851 [Trapelia coarctata]|nr:hypothetical protein [Trapelia coarctata]